MEKQEQIRAIAEHYGLTRNSDFARFFGISEQAAYQQQKQGSIKYEEVYRRCPDLSPDWLLNGGEGPMLRAERIENSGNFGFGDHVRQNLHIRESESLKTALESLRAEQDSLKRAQEQISGLIALLQSRG